MQRIELVKESLSDHPELGGGYAIMTEDKIFVDPSLPLQKQKEIVIHEVLELNFGTEIEHYRFDLIAADILGVLEQL